MNQMERNTLVDVAAEIMNIGRELSPGSKAALNDNAERLLALARHKRGVGQQKIEG